MKWKTLPKNECAQAVAALPQGFCADNLDDDYAQLRLDLKEIATSIISVDKEYAYDLSFGIPMYVLLNEKYGMKERQASIDGVWRYLSIDVIPDVVMQRWGKRDARFWKESRRIWLKALWWYVHLSWQGNPEDTENILKNNTTDIMVQLVERPGPQGYRVPVCRQLMKRLNEVPDERAKADLFRKVMVLNTTRLKVLEPSLLNLGEEEYVEQLYRYFDA